MRSSGWGFEHQPAGELHKMSDQPAYLSLASYRCCADSLRRLPEFPPEVVLPTPLVETFVRRHTNLSQFDAYGISTIRVTQWYEWVTLKRERVRSESAVYSQRFEAICH